PVGAALPQHLPRRGGHDDRSVLRRVTAGMSPRQRRPVATGVQELARSRVVAVAVAVLVGVLVIGYLALGMPGMDHDGDGSAGDAGTMEASEMGDMRVGADEFAERMEHEDAVVVNVHVPYEGEIAGTDLFIPYD